MLLPFSYLAYFPYSLIFTFWRGKQEGWDRGEGDGGQGTNSSKLLQRPQEIRASLLESSSYIVFTNHFLADFIAGGVESAVLGGVHVVFAERWSWVGACILGLWVEVSFDLRDEVGE